MAFRADGHHKGLTRHDLFSLSFSLSLFLNFPLSFSCGLPPLPLHPPMLLSPFGHVCVCVCVVLHVRPRLMAGASSAIGFCHVFRDLTRRCVCPCSSVLYFWFALLVFVCAYACVCLFVCVWSCTDVCACVYKNISTLQDVSEVHKSLL